MAASVSVRCHCGEANAAGRKFCRSCGASLIQRCVQCRTEVAIDERFCGNCGVDLRKAHDAQSEAFQSQLAEARRHLQFLRFEEAAAILHPLSRLDGSETEAFSTVATELLEHIKVEQDRWSERVIEQQQVARGHLERHAYEEAWEVLSTIPAQFGTPQTRELIEEVSRVRAELRRLPADIKSALSTGRKLDAFPLLDRLLYLKPDHAQAKQLAEKLRDDVLRTALKKLGEHEYRTARELLEQLPAMVRSTDAENLLDKARELERLTVAVTQSPEVDEVVEALANKLVKIAPGNIRAAERLAQIKQLRASGKSARTFESQFSIPITRFTLPTRCDIAPPAKAVLEQHPGEFLVAFGLALQAVQKARVSLNLLSAPKGSSGLLGGLSLTRRKPRGGWGIDVGTTGVRAIRLSPPTPEGSVQIDAAVFLPFATSEPQGDAAAAVAQALASLAEKYPFPKVREQRDVVVAALSGDRTLGRVFDLPPAPSKRLPELVEFEARHQIPIPLTELAWRYQVLEESTDASADQNGRHLLLLAAREFLVGQQVALFEGAQVPLDELTSTPIAIHNAVVHERAGEANFLVASIDMGARGLDFVVSSPNRLWFRSCAVGGKLVTDALVRSLHLTQATAEEVKRAPQRARRFYQFEDAIQPSFLQIHSEIARSLAAFAGQFPGRAIEKLCLLGGGAKLPGLMQSLVHGQ